MIETAPVVPVLKLDLPPVTVDAPLLVPVATAALLPELVKARTDVMVRTQALGDQRASVWNRTKLGIWSAGAAAVAGVTSALAQLWPGSAPTPSGSIQAWTTFEHAKLACYNAEPTSQLQAMYDATDNNYRLAQPITSNGEVVHTFQEFAASVCQREPSAVQVVHDAHAAAPSVLDVLASPSVEVALAAAAVSVGFVGVRWLKNRKAERASLTAAAVEPLRLAHQGSTGAHHEALRLVAKEVFEDVRARNVRGPEARAAIADIIDTTSELSAEDKALATAASGIVKRLLTPSGKVRPLLADDANYVRQQVLTVNEAERQLQLRNEIRAMFFDKEGRYRGRSERAVDVPLLDFLLGIKPGN